MTLPPGVRYLTNVFPWLCVPPLTVSPLQYVFRSRMGYAFPIWLAILAYLVCWPIAFIIYIQTKEIKKHLEALAYGAVLAPVVAAKYPGNIDAVFQTLNNDGGKIIGR